ncbi:TonB dependent receptor [Chitinophaga nivalis]|uniref:TonB dependent receptor n=1 Tax=Chitinophaga nivalis TaxID=2991709 RepID=A0ABT3IJ49_9BACT|nr:TonB dependent receptor [Chitinophaga nivalis]MCW3466337.1 TonB dependent receptor [Chitinophaga nivalis]MCW3483972.1 TonB dependent receptor [Chitinophaga nivalis]
MKRYIAAMMCLFLGMVVALKAQTGEKGNIHGSLSDTQGKGVRDATVMLSRTGHPAVLKTALSDATGKFLFDGLPPGSYTITITAPRFETFIRQDIAVRDAQPSVGLGALSLQPAVVKLNAVTVKGETPFIERRIDKTVVNVENSIVSIGASALEVLEKLPGVRVKQDGQINLEGKAGVTVYLDGKASQLSAEDLANLLRGMPASGIQKIELMPKPSARYDAAGSGGIINIVRKKNRKDGWNGSVNGGYGQGRYPKYNGGLDLGFRNRQYNLYLSYAYMANNTFRTAATTRRFLEPGNHFTEFVSENYHIRKYRTHTPTAGVDFYLSKRTTLSVSGTGSFQTYRSNSDAWSLESYNGAKPVNRYDFLNKTNDRLSNYAANMHLVHQTDTSGGELTVDLDYSYYRKTSSQDMINRKTRLADDSVGAENILLDQGGKLRIYSGKIDYVRPLRREIRLEGGIKLSYVRSDNLMAFVGGVGGPLVPYSHNDFRYTEQVNAAYLNLNKQWQKVTVQLGLRGEQTIGNGRQELTQQEVKQNYIQLFPSVFVDYKPNAVHGFNFQFGRRIDRPAYLDLNPLRRISNAISFMQGNPYLRPQLSYNAAVTWSWKGDLQTTLGYTRYTDFMTTMAFPDAEKGVSGTMLVNIEQGQSWNADVSYSKKINQWWTSNNSISVFYQAFRGRVNGIDFSNDGKPSFYINTNNNFAITKQWSAELTYWYLYKNLDGASVYEPNSSLSIGIKKSLFGNRGYLALNVTDLLKTEAFVFNTNSGSIYELWDIRNDTRAVKLNFNYRFGKGNNKKMKLRSGAEEERKRAAK